MKWGGYWGQLWGGSAKRESWEQGSVLDAKQDTVFLGKSSDGTWADLATDLSQHGADLTVGTSPRLYLASPGTHWGDCDDEWTVEMDGSWDNVSGGLIVKMQFAAGDDLVVRLSSVGELEVAKSSTLLGGIGVPGASAKRMVVGVACRSHRDTTGASDAKRCYLYAMDASGNVEFGQVETSAWPGSTPTAVDFFDETSETAMSGVTVYAVRVSNAFHTITEVREDFVARTAAISRTADLREEGVVAGDGQLENDGELAGPLHSSVSGALRRADLRTVGPVLNKRYLAYTFTGASSAAPTPKGAWMTPSPDGGATYIGLQWLSYAPVPSAVNRLRVRAHVTVSATQTVSVYSVSRRPESGVSNGGPPLAYDVASASVTTSGWADLGYMRVARDVTGYGTYIVVGIAPGNTETIVVNALVVEPAVVSTAGLTGGP